MTTHTDHTPTPEYEPIFGGAAVITPGIDALGEENVERIVQAVAAYADLSHASNPHEGHDFGAFEADGHKVIFKIDYLDKSLQHHSPDPANSSVTERVITIMLAEEY
jgi:hypothetical protein